MSDAVDHPTHYNSHPSGVEAITVCEHMSFNVGNAMKYLWRAGLKGSKLEDLKKAAWYVEREIKLLRPPMEVKFYKTVAEVQADFGVAMPVPVMTVAPPKKKRRR